MELKTRISKMITEKAMKFLSKKACLFSVLRGGGAADRDGSM